MSVIRKVTTAIGDVIFDDYGMRIVWVITFLLVGVLAFVGLIVGVALGAERHSCNREASAMDREWRFGWAEGCLVQLDNGTYVDIDKYRISNTEDVSAP